MIVTSNPQLEQKKPLLEQFRETRSRTLELVKTLEKDDFVVQTAFFMSPPKWHIGHVSWIYEAIMSKLDKNYEFYSKEFSEYLNSYYQQFGVPHDKGLRGVISRPTVDQIFQYFNTINQRVEKFIETQSLDENAVRLITMGFHHECQHQELLVYDLQHLLAEQYRPVRKNQIQKQNSVERDSVQIKGGLYTMGFNGKEFCYDIELPEHKVYLNDYKIDVFPVTNQQYLEFIEDGGYETYKYWLSDGWEKVKENKWKAPMYWEKIDGKWNVRDFLGIREINPNEPVCHVSFYEADAYCKWARKRLPTEAEWEKAACWDENKQEKTIFPWGNDQPTEEKCNLLESYYWGCTEIGTYPNGKSPSGCQQMIGDVWEWTSSEFTGYPGFKTGFDEYNDKWFTNQKVLRGGSFGTPKMSIRGSYRNFFRLDERWLFSGFRCAEDI
ncbi:Iron-dependent oxidoreductase EgtB protein [Marine Group I thaumarchaeote SCGC AAA799-E16]|uniref:Iron-dependent oxidoreductase EgtB protein n=4 Tax=Marine Group I TaxID=905826 RepID=A0A087S9C1_9ARCH|nr:Iron-dependent oxidoreductase EgtB protein [Marine Group I thaumarchaeote SCGC AAA799-E16]KFM16448.1 Iron-dependent oxidoreductase EgtB protein [Marine Group I thaumarchaeote SCGC AAA799-D11]KFM18414.1 Serine-threonine-protein kinase pkn1 [Marine Group I thaumarchaeote SCGC RSA3]KFM22325.1 Iron-dependent oxidoreductase EgtB protein [Marine Group I thaumarchaeote SCGC AAA799-B03]